ncbi:MAG: metalloregulator ArsR/SmtB family transcription factor [Pseudoxanthomonas sp.]
MKLESAVVSLAALAQKSRLAVFRHLVQLGPSGSTPGDLIARLGMSASTLSFHLKALAQAGLIDSDQAGRSITYRANFIAMQGLVDYLTENCCAGEPSACKPGAAKARRKRAS